ncbi:cell division protein FtsN [Litorivivens lipolytica]|uniref:Cell division protein FtsN n=1 Tax=Litorivivens lipolytica TaxID=1524264 RepID=A0A7W4Z771_9GAMM|nr:cell division protein FtsN [Litorivivens lipolytica]
MANNRSRSRGATRQNNTGVPAWAIFCAGALCGGFLTFLVFLGGVDSGDSKADVASKNAPKPAKPAKQTTTETQFDFFTLLPEREVIVPEEQQPREESSANQEQFQYILQAGSFKTNADADRRRAELLLLGLEAKIEAVEANGDTWHRVYVGPFTSRSKLSKARTTLISEGIETLLLKRKVAG